MLHMGCCVPLGPWPLVAPLHGPPRARHQLSSLHASAMLLVPPLSCPAGWVMACLLAVCLVALCSCARQVRACWCPSSGHAGTLLASHPKQQLCA